MRGEAVRVEAEARLRTVRPLRLLQLLRLALMGLREVVVVGVLDADRNNRWCFIG